MKSNEFVKEDEWDEYDDEGWKQSPQQALAVKYSISIDNLDSLDLIKRDCQPFLKEVDYDPFDKYPLFRGMQTDNYFIKKNVNLVDRKPVDMGLMTHDQINKYFTQEYGAPFRDALFATGSFIDAEGYGNAYYIFPIGEFKYLWSSKIGDLYGDMNNISRQTDTPFDQKALFNFLDWGNYQTTNLKRALNGSSEIMIRCKQYYALEVNSVYDEKEGMIRYLKA